MSQDSDGWVELELSDENEQDFAEMSDDEATF